MSISDAELLAIARQVEAIPSVSRLPDGSIDTRGRVPERLDETDQRDGQHGRVAMSIRNRVFHEAIGQERQSRIADAIDIRRLDLDRASKSERQRWGLDAPRTKITAADSEALRRR